MRRPILTLSILGGAAVLCLLLHVSFGTSDTVGVGSVVREILRGPGHVTEAANDIVWQSRLPRAVTCMLVGAILGSVGAAFQALLRNPLGDPYIIGVSSGAAVGGSIALVAGVGTAFGNLGIAGAGFVTGMLTLALVYGLAIRRGVVEVRTLLLAGVSIGALLSAILSLVLLLSGRDERDVLRWLLGDTSRTTWEQCALLSVALLFGFSFLVLETRRLNAFAIGEETAQRLGVDVRRLTKVVLLTAGAMTAAAVGTVGVIGFLGLVAPHIARRLVGVDWRLSLPGAAVTGALLLVAADSVSQRFFSAVTHTPGMDLPVGLVTSVLGAPSLLILLRSTR